MNRYDVMIGLTRSDRNNGYISFCDGYRAGAQQDLLMLVLHLDQPVSDQVIVEAAFVAMNHPEPWEMKPSTAKKVWQGLLSYKGQFRSLSVGDTVTVNGRKWECKRSGWARVEEKAPADKYTAGLVADIFTRHGITDASIATLPDIIDDLARLVEHVSTETTEMALANLTDPACPASIV